MAFPCACSSKGPQGSAYDCQYRCTACGHHAAMHNRCRDRCIEAHCECLEVTGVPNGACVYLDNQEQKERNHDIWVLYKEGVKQSRIAKDYGLSKGRIHRIIMREEKQWTHG